MLYRFILFFSFLVFSASTLNADDTYLESLLNSKSYTKAYPLIEQQIYIGEYKYAFAFAYMHENGFGVEKNLKKSIELYKKALNGDRRKDAAYKLGLYYYDSGNMKKAYYWWRIGATMGSFKSMHKYSLMNLSRKIDNDFFNTYLASIWVQYGVSLGDIGLKNVLEEIPTLTDTGIYAKLRRYQIQKTVYERKPWGILLGEKFHEELLFPDKNYKKKPVIRRNIASINHYKSILPKYANQDDIYFKNLTYLNARATLDTNTVYRVQAYYFFRTEEECEKFENYYIQKLFSNSSKDTSSLKSVKLKNLVKYVDIGVPRGVSSTKKPYGVVSTDNLKGIRYLVEHYRSKKGDGYYVRVVAIDFHALKLKIAEAIQSDPFFKYVGEDEENTHSYMKHFGLTLLEGIPSSVYTRKIKSSSRENLYEFNSIYPHKFFQKYKVATTLFTKKIIKIEAEGIFTKSMDAFQAQKGTIANIYRNYNTRKGCSSGTLVISSTKGLSCYADDMGKSDVEIKMNYNKEKNKKFKFTFKAYSKYGLKIKDRESWLLNY